jgi:hypothetical protein
VHCLSHVDDLLVTPGGLGPVQGRESLGTLGLQPLAGLFPAGRRTGGIGVTVGWILVAVGVEAERCGGGPAQHPLGSPVLGRVARLGAVLCGQLLGGEQLEEVVESVALAKLDVNDRAAAIAEGYNRGLLGAPDRP